MVAAEREVSMVSLNDRLAFTWKGQVFCGIPADFHPVSSEIEDNGVRILRVEGSDDSGLSICLERRTYHDSPAEEYDAVFENRGIADSAIIEQPAWSFLITAQMLEHGNGDPWHTSGYSTEYAALDTAVSVYPHVDPGRYGSTPYQNGGTPCCGAAPYFRLFGEDGGTLAAVGWQGVWQADFTPESDGVVRMTVGQRALRSVIRPGERFRLSSVTLLPYSGTDDNGFNLWRRFYFAHVVPTRNGQPLAPMILYFTSKAEGEEATTLTESDLHGIIDTCIENGLIPDVLWVDAGWYPCPPKWWPEVGDWLPDPARFPRGLSPIAERMQALGGELMLWFEPERVTRGKRFAALFEDGLLYLPGESKEQWGQAILNLSNPAVAAAAADDLSQTLRSNGVTIYRQDFNFDPLPVWENADADNRVGATENLYCQGYMQMWDLLLEQNEGLLIDSCCGGGRRNEIEAMHRAVPLHYTDLGTDPVLMQHQHAVMFRWIPYFSSSTGWSSFPPPDRYEYHCMLSPCFKLYTTEYTPKELSDLHVMHTIWKKAAPMMIDGDFYLLADSCGQEDRYFAMQFDISSEGFVQIIRNRACRTPVITVYPHLDPAVYYRFENAETAEVLVMTGAQAEDGFSVSIPKRSGCVFFYKKLI